jgi:spore maturation protein CgeB
LFELAALGCCVVSNPVEGMGEWFEVGEEIVMLESCEEIVGTYRWLLSHDEQRLRMGQRAHERILREHTYQHRADQLLRILESVVGG